MKKAILIGSSGQVAKGMATELRKRGVEVLSTSSKSGAAFFLDLAEPESIRTFFRAAESRFGRGEAEVFLAGALTHVDRCETERELCERINAKGPALVAAECVALGYGLTYFSTEYVFGGAEYEGGAIGPFSEEDPPAPTSWYGECKRKAEQAVLATTSGKALVIRTTMVFSWDSEGMNFLMQYFRQLDLVESGKKPAVFRIPADQISTPTYAPALAEAAYVLRERGHSGIVNYVGSDLLSRRELVEKVIHAFGYERESALRFFTFLPTAELSQTARRPLSAGLTTDKARKLGCRVLSLDEAFADIRKKRAN